MIWIIIAIVVLIFIWGVALYNGFVTLRTRAQEAWADIDVQLKRRYDLIPNLVNTVKGYASHESETFNSVTSARARATQVHVDASQLTPEALTQMAGAESGLTQALGKLLAVAESYPDLKANENFIELQRELSDTENKIQAARRFYNGNVRDLNIKVESFPSSVIAKMFSFMKMEFFDLEENDVAKEVPNVSF